MRHRDRYTSILVAECRNSVGRAVWIKRIARSDTAVVVNISKAHQATGRTRRRRSIAREFRPPLTVGHGDRQKRALHSLQEHRGAAQDLHESEPSFILLASVAHESRPVCGTWNEALQRGKHLAAIADAECEAVGAGEERTEFLAHGLVEQDRLGPALACSQHIAIGEAPAGHETLELA